MKKKYDAITLDTSIFKRYQLRLDHGLLKQLYQFKDSKIDVILPDIVLQETKLHLEKEIREGKELLDKCIKNLERHSIIDKENLDKIKQIHNNMKPEVIAEQKITDFISKTGLEVIKSEECLDIKNLLNLYFNNQPPFAETGKKKHEFPDAIALLSLVSWAEEYNRKILAISNDNDWEKFTQHSDWIEVNSDLSSAMTILQSQTDPSKLLNNLSQLLLEDSHTDFYEQIESEASYYTENLYVHADATSSFRFTDNDVTLSFESLEIDRDENKNLILKLIKYEDESVVIKLSISINATAYANFDFYVRDTIDHDDINIGSCSKEIDFSYNSEVLITFFGDFENASNLDEIDIDNIEFLSSPSTIDFGEIEPGYDF